jgi:hypothetical protein
MGGGNTKAGNASRTRSILPEGASAWEREDRRDGEESFVSKILKTGENLKTVERPKFSQPHKPNFSRMPQL